MRIKSPLLNLMERVILHVHYQKYLKKKKKQWAGGGQPSSSFILETVPPQALSMPREKAGAFGLLGKLSWHLASSVQV